MKNNISNKEIILDTALNLFALRGYEAVGVREICEASGITKPTLYHYFGNKIGLFEALLAREFRDFFEGLNKAADYDHDIDATMRSIAVFVFDYNKAHESFFRMRVSLSTAPPESEVYPIFSPYSAEYVRIPASMFRLAVVDHGNMKGRHIPYALSLIGLLDTYTVILLNNKDKPDDAFIYKVLHQFMHGIFS